MSKKNSLSSLSSNPSSNLNFNKMRNNHFQFDVGSNIKPYFDDLEKCLIKYISESTYVVGCVAWLTNKNIIEALDNLSGAKIIVNKEEYLNNNMQAGKKFFYQCLRGKYNDIPDMFDINCSCCSKSTDLCDNFKKNFGDLNKKAGAILTCGIVNNLSKMHHKFLIFLNKKFEPTGVWTGSYNLSQNSNFSLENALYITDPNVVMAYLTEFKSIYRFSEPYNWDSGLLYASI